jgi:hypothetical protein
MVDHLSLKSKSSRIVQVSEQQLKSDTHGNQARLTVVQSLVTKLKLGSQHRPVSIALPFLVVFTG